MMPAMRPALPLLATLLLSLVLGGCNLLQVGQSIPPQKILDIDKVRERDPAAAAKQLEALLAEKPRDALGWTILGHIREDLDEDEAARAAYDKALAVDPEQFQAITGLGILERKRGNLEAAMKHYRRAVAINPDYAQAWSSMTTIAFKLGNDADALEYARKGWDLDREDPVVAANLAIAWHYNGNERERDRMTEIARKLGYHNMELLGKLYSGEYTIRD